MSAGDQGGTSPQPLDVESRRRRDGTLDFAGLSLTAADVETIRRAVRRTESPAPVLFDRCRFTEEADFRGVRFPAPCSFAGAVFSGSALFTGCTFEGDAVFDHAHVEGPTASFERANFRSWSSFVGLRVPSGSFLRAQFSDDAIFRDAVLGDVDFAGTRWDGRADFSDVTWGTRDETGARVPQSVARFRDAVFAGAATFAGAVGVDRPEFRGAVSAASPDFRGSRGFPMDRRADIEVRRFEDGKAVAADAGGVRLSWDSLIQALQLLSLGAALVLWIVVVGGAVLWARLGAAGLPQPTRTVTLTPQEVLVAHGLEALRWPLLAALLVAFLAYVVLSTPLLHEGFRQLGRLRPSRWLARVLAVLSALAVVALIVLIAATEFLAGYAVLIVIVPILVALVLALALIRWTSPVAVALLAFAAILVAFGAIEYLREKGNSNPSFEPATLVFDDRDQLSGLLMAQTDDQVALVCGVDKANRRLVVVPTDDVVSIAVEREVAIDDDDKAKAPLECLREEARGVPPAARADGTPNTSGGGVETDDPEPKNDPDPPDGEAINDPDPDDPEPKDDPDPDDPDPNDEGGGGGGGGGKPPRVSGPLRPRIPVSDSGLALVRLRRFSERVSGVMQIITVEAFEKDGWTRPRRVKVGTKAFGAQPDGDVLVQFHLSGYMQARLREAGRDGIATRLRVTARGNGGAAATKQVPLTLVARS